MILAGQVLVRDVPVTKAGTKVPLEAPIRIRGESVRFVSRGGEKLDAALSHFQITLSGKVVIDVGSSTGGFTDCMLQRGALLVYAVDVGTQQLDYKMRKDKRVVVMEETHAVSLKPSLFDPRPSFAAIDVSFISLRKILEPVCAVLLAPFEILMLVKPQFELGREFVGKGGVVKDDAHQSLAIQLVAEFAVEKRLTVQGSCPSVLRGAKKGNQEYFLFAKRD